jgi:hypothetical protein
MEELVNLVADKVGISKEQAAQAVEMVLAFIKKNLPEPLAGQIEGFMEGGGLDQADDIVQGLSGLLGGLGGGD